MQKLHLVGFTTDQKGLILSARRGARSGSFHVALDDQLADAVEELRARQAEEEEAEEVADAEPVRAPRVESALPVREIQARLRHGRTVQDVAKAAGVDAEWVERFAAPVFAEQAQVITKVRGTPLRRARLGPSSHAIGDAVRYNLAERGIALTPEEFSSAWTTRQLADGRWAVRFTFRHRNKDQVLRFDLDDGREAVTAADRTSGQLGYVAPPPSARPSAPARPRPPAAPAEASRPTAKRATVTTGFRADSAKATSRPAKERERANVAMRKAAKQRAVEAERAAARKAREKQAADVRRQREAKAEEARKGRERAAAERAKAAAARKKAVAAKKKAAERARQKAAKQAADQAQRAEAALRAAERAAAKKAARTSGARKATKKNAAKKATRPRTAATKAATKRAAAPKSPARKAPAKRAVATGAPAKKTPATKRVPAATPTKRPAAKATARALDSTPVARTPAVPKAAPSVTPTPPARHLAPEPRAEADRPLSVVVLDDLTGPAAEAERPSPPPARPQFRPGWVESVDRPPVRPSVDSSTDEWDAPAALAPNNGLAPVRPLDRPRRTQPLRAT